MTNDEQTLINEITALNKEIGALEQENTHLKGRQNSIKDSNSSSIKLYYDTNDTFHKYKLSNILIGIFFIIGTVCFYMLQYKYEQFVYFINNITELIKVFIEMMSKSSEKENNNSDLKASLSSTFKNLKNTFNNPNIPKNTIVHNIPKLNNTNMLGKSVDINKIPDNIRQGVTNLKNFFGQIK